MTGRVQAVCRTVLEATARWERRQIEAAQARIRVELLAAAAARHEREPVEASR